MSSENRLTRIGQCLACGLLCQMALSYPLWFGARSYPLLPVWGTPLPEALVFLAPFFSSLLLLALLLLLFGRHTRATFALLFVATLSTLALDLTKCQIWFYFQIILLGVLALKTHYSTGSVMRYLQRLFPFVYFWGGLHKINGYYFEDTFPWLMEAFSWSQPMATSFALICLSVLVEVGISIGLWVLSNKRPAVVAGILFHLFILLFLGPLGHDWNEVVWPWNITMIALLYFLYWPKEDQKVQLNKAWKPIILPLFLLGFAPLLHQVQLWPSILSFKMYTGDQMEGILYTHQAYLPELSAVATEQINCVEDRCYLIADDWAFAEMGVAPFSSTRRLKQLAKAYCSCLTEPEAGGLKLLEVGKWKTEKPLQDFPCRDLLNLSAH